MKSLFVILLASAALVGCSSAPVDHTAYLAAQVQMAAQPTLTIDCPSGCTASFTDPRDRNLQLPQTTNGYDAAIAISDRLLGAAVSVAPWYGVTRLGIEGIQGVRDARGPTHIGDVVGADKVGGNKHVGDYTGSIRRDTIGGNQHTGDYTGPVSRDSIGGDRTINSGRLESPDSYDQSRRTGAQE